MGSTGSYEDERPVHTVELDGYFIDKYEVTNAQYEADAYRKQLAAQWEADRKL